MSRKQGAGNLAMFNSIRSANTIPMLEHELRLYRKRKLRFETTGLLAAHVSERINVHRTTLMRNRAYLQLLLAYQAGQPGAVERAPDDTQDPAILQAKLAVARLDISALRHEAKVAAARAIRHAEAVPSSNDGGSVTLADLSAVLVSLLSRFPEFLHLDLRKRELVDLSARPSERVVAGPDRIRGFCSWLEQNKSLPHIQKLVSLSKRS